MCFRRKSAALPRFEIHYVVARPGNMARSVMFQDAFAAFSQHGKSDAKAGVGGLRAGDRLKQQINRRVAIQTRQLSRDVREATRLRRNRELRNQPIERSQNSRDTFHGIRGRIYSDDGVPAAIEQAIERSQQNAANVIRWVVWLQANAEYAALAERVSAARNVANLARRK